MTKTFAQKIIEPDDLIVDNPLFIRKEQPLNINQSQIRSLSKNAVIEVKFKRRIWPIKFQLPWQKTEQRRMLCTANWSFVNNEPLFKFVPPKGLRSRSESWYISRKLIIVWDVLHNNWRHISLDDYDVINYYFVRTNKEQEQFVKYFKNALKRWGRSKMKLWMNR